MRDFVYRDREHLAALRRRREWFAKLDLTLAMWWVPPGHVPDLPEAERRLRLLAERGPTADAFTFQTPFDAPGAAVLGRAARR